MSDLIRHKLSSAIRDYHMSEKAKNLIEASNPLLICGVSAAGKSTVINKLLTHAKFAQVISHTTRQPRHNDGHLEQNGEHFWFVTEAEMYEMVQRQEFLEVKDVHSGWFYGKSIFELDKVVSHGKRAIFDIDVRGALDFIKVSSNISPIFLLPPSYEIWMQRLSSRGNMSDIEKSKRLRSAKNEIQTAVNNRHFILVINHEAEETVSDVLRGTYKNPQHQHTAYHLALDYLQFLKDY